MKRVFAVLAVLVVAVVTALAQQTQPASEGLVVKQRIIQSQEGPPPSPPNGDFVVIYSENFGDKVVKNAT